MVFMAASIDGIFVFLFVSNTASTRMSFNCPRIRISYEKIEKKEKMPSGKRRI
jgi:hypothetical protein